MNLFNTGIRPAVDEYLLKKAAEERDYGDYWSASSAGYCMRKNLYEKLKIPKTQKEDGRKQRVFEAGHIFHEWMQRITKGAGISIAQEVELQDEDLMVRGHFDDLVLVDGTLLLYDYKTQNSRAFTWQKGKPMSYYHHMQLGTYMLMLRKKDYRWRGTTVFDLPANTLNEARIMKISKDDLRMAEQDLHWSDDLEQEVLMYWSTLNRHYREKTLPPCTCADREGGFMAKEAYNPYFYNGEPCSAVLYQKHMDNVNK